MYVHFSPPPPPPPPPQQTSQSVGTLPPTLIVKVLQALFSMGWHDRALSFFERVRANRQAPDALVARVIYELLAETEQTSMGPQLAPVEYYVVLLIAAQKAQIVASALLRHFCVSARPSRAEADALLLFCMRAEAPYGSPNEYAQRLRNGTAYRMPLTVSTSNNRRIQMIREDNARWLSLVGRALTSCEFTDALSPLVRAAAVESLLSAAGLDRSHHNNEPLVLAYRSAVGHQDESALEHCAKAHAARSSNSDRITKSNVWLPGIDRDVSRAVSFGNASAELMDLLRQRGPSFSDRFRVATKTTIDHLKILRSEVSATSRDEAVSLLALASGSTARQKNQLLAGSTSAPSSLGLSNLEALSAESIEEIIAGPISRSTSTPPPVNDVRLHKKIIFDDGREKVEEDEETDLIASMLSTSPSSSTAPWVPCAQPSDKDDVHFYFRCSMRIYAPSGSASASTPERTQSSGSTIYAGTSASNYGTSWDPDASLPPSAWAERYLTIALGAYVAAVREEGVALRERKETIPIVSSLVHESVICSLVHRGNLTAALQAVRVAGVLSTERATAGGELMMPGTAFWAAIGHLFYGAVALRRLVRVERHDLVSLATALLHPFRASPELHIVMLRAAEKFHDSSDGTVPAELRAIGDTIVLPALRETISALASKEDN